MVLSAGAIVASLGAAACAADLVVDGGTTLAISGEQVVDSVTVNDGRLHIVPGGVLRALGSADSSIALPSGAVGEILVDGGVLTLGGILSIGVSGVGKLSIENGGSVEVLELLGLGGGPGGALGSGLIEVSGPGSRLTFRNSLLLGAVSQGSLEIRDGASVDASNSVVVLGVGGAGQGRLMIAGEHSVLNMQAGNALYVGLDGTGALLLREGGLGRVGDGVSVAMRAGSTGTVIFGAAAGDEAAGAGLLQGENGAAADIVFGSGDGSVVFNHTGSAYEFAGKMSGSGTIDQLAGVTFLTGNSSGFTGSTNIDGGMLIVDSLLGTPNQGITLGGTVNVNRGTLAGSGALSGSVFVTDGAVASSKGPGALVIGGDLSLASGSSLNFDLGSPGVDNDPIEVGSDLTLDGTLNVTDAGGFGFGLYHLINYGGALTDNGLDVGLTPMGFASADLTVQTAVAGQVNLLVGAPTPTSFFFWDGANIDANGAIDGGSFSWTTTGTNWTIADGSENGVFDPSVLLIFSGTAGTVTVDDSAGGLAIANGMQFAVHGYAVTGDAIGLTGANVIRVGDGTTAGADIVATIASDITGTGSFVKTDLGTLVLTGANTYSGGTTVSGGTLIGDSTSLQGDIENNATLTFDQTADGIYAGLLSGAGLLTKSGQGELVLEGDSSAFAGVTNVTDGLLSVNGILGGSTYVFGGALGGSGTLDGVTIGSGGTIAPGNSIGAINAGDITFNAGSTYSVELADGGFVAGIDNDLIDVTGAATINGGNVHVTAANGSDDGTSYTPGTYTILTAAGGVTGTFDTLSDDYAFLKFALGYGTNDVFLTSSVAGSSFCLPGMTANQCASGQGAFSLGPGNSIFDAVLMLSDAEAPRSLDQISGEIYASTKTALVEGSHYVREASLNRLDGVFGGTGSGIWTQSFGSQSRWSGDGNAAGMDSDGGGFVLGVDGQVLGNVYLGVQAGYGHSSLTASDRASSTMQSAYTLGAYAGRQWDVFSVIGGVANSWHRLETLRSVDFPGFSDKLWTDYNAQTLQAYAEMALSIPTPHARFEPFVNVAYVNLRTDEYVEMGGAAAIAASSSNTDATFATFGLRGETQIDLADMDATISASIGLRHAFADTPADTHRFVAGGDQFTVTGIPIAEDVLALNAALVSNVAENATFGLHYTGQIGAGISEHGVKASFNIRF